MAACAMLAVLCAQMPSVSARDKSHCKDRLTSTVLADMSIYELLDLEVVTASKTAQSIEQAPSVISTITRQEMQRRGYRSVAEALAFLPGFSFVDDHVLPNMAVRGVYGGLRGWGRFIKVMIDGHPIAFQQDNTNWLGPNLIPLEMVDRIEVVRGPGSALYGANAFLGVVNIITRKSDDAPPASAMASGLLTEANAGGEGGLMLSHRFGNWDVMLAGSAARENRSGLALERTFPLQDDSDLFPGESSANDVRRPKALYLRAGYADDNVGTFRLSAFVQHLQGATEFQDFSVLTHKSAVSLINGSARLKWTHEVGEFDVTAELGYSAGGSTNGDRLYVGSTDSFIRRRLSYRGMNAVAETTYHIGCVAALTVGADVQVADQLHPFGEEVLVQDRGVLSAGTVLPAGVSQSSLLHNAGTYLEIFVQPLDKLSLTGGLRFDRNSVYGSNASARAAVVVSPLKWLTTKALFGTSIMAPAPDQLYSQAALGDSDIIGNPGLRAQKAVTGELAVEINRDNISLRVDGFVTEVTDKIEFQKLAVSRRPVNRDRLLVIGIESELKAKIDRFTVNASLMWLDGKRESDSPIVDSANLLMTGAPERTAALGVYVAVPELYFGAYVEGRYRSELAPSRDNFVANDRQAAYVLPAVFLLDLNITSLGVNLRDHPEHDGENGSDTVFFLRVTNLFDERYSVPGFSGGAFGSNDVPALGRSFFVGMRHRLP